MTTKLNELNKDEAWLAFSSIKHNYTREQFEADWLEFCEMKAAFERAKTAN